MVNYRAIVIDDVVGIEKEISDLLKLILGIHIPNSKTLGNKSSSIPFMSKILLLNDIGNLSNDDVKLFRSLSEIRNQFAHNLECDSIESFASINENSWKFLTKKFPDNSFYGTYKALYRSCYTIIEKIKEDQKTSLKFEIEKLIFCDTALHIDKLFECDNFLIGFQNIFDEIITRQIKTSDKVRLFRRSISSLISLEVTNRAVRVGNAIDSLSSDQRLQLLSNYIKKDSFDNFIEDINNNINNRIDFLDYDLEEEIESLDQEEWGLIESIEMDRRIKYEEAINKYIDISEEE